MNLDEDCISDWGYILPNGSFYGCGHHEHTELAQFILKRNTESEWLGEDADLEADRRGWIKLGRISKYSGLACHIPRHITPEQENTLQFWCVKHSIEYADLQQM